MQGLKFIGRGFRVLRPLFQVHSYLYAQVCSMKSECEVLTAALYVYENEDPSQCLKMLKEKLDIEDNVELSNLIFPNYHIKQPLNDKNISLFFISQLIVPLRNCKIKQFSSIEFLELLHGGLSSLNQLHTRDIIHGNITMTTCYLTKGKRDPHCKFALNILDTSYFTEEDCVEGIQQKLFQSEGQSLGQSISFKDDLESLVYVVTHLVSKGKTFTLQRFQLEWITQSQFLRWKNCEFFKELIHILPPELQILIEIYTIAKTLKRNQKPDYLKLMKKVLNVIATHQRRTKTTEQIQLSISQYKKGKQTLDKKGKENQDGIDLDDISIKLKGEKRLKATKRQSMQPRKDV